MDSFREAVTGKKFTSDMPTEACIFHLITGRQPSGVAGLAYVQTNKKRKKEKR